MERELILAAHKVCKAFGPTRALIDVDVEVRKGEIRGLIGENGSGKSTFCSIVAGALEKDSGELELFRLKTAHPLVNTIISYRQDKTLTEEEQTLIDMMRAYVARL